MIFAIRTQDGVKVSWRKRGVGIEQQSGFRSLEDAERFARGAIDAALERRGAPT